jgi:hypothetical protein
VASTFEREKSLEREIRAFHWVRLLAELPDRSAGSPGEVEAADRLEAWLRDLGVDDVCRAPVASAPRPGLSLALHLGLGALACAVGGIAGAALGALVAFSYGRELRRGEPLLSRALRARPSLNLVARVGAVAPRRRVVLCARLDTNRAGWIYGERATDFLASLRSAVSRPAALPEALLIAVAALLVASWLGTGGPLVLFARLALCAALALGCAAALEWALAPPTPGANENASGVAAMLTSAEQLLSQLPPEVELWMVGTGAGEVGCRGMRAFLAEHADWPVETTFFVNFAHVGGGDLHVVRSEGALRRTVYPPTLLELARRVAAGGVFGAITAVDLPADTDGGVPAAADRPTLSLVSLESHGEPRNHRRRQDTSEALDMATVVRAGDFGAAVAFSALAGETAPIAVL